MGMFNRLFGKSSSESTAIIERSIEGIELCTSIDVFENQPEWEELFGPLKEIFESGIPNPDVSRIYVKESENKSVVCGFLNDSLYKVAITLAVIEKDTYFTQFQQKYGKGNKIRRGYFEWENNNTKLELMEAGPQLNIYLTDKNLLLKEYSLSRD